MGECHFQERLCWEPLLSQPWQGAPTFFRCVGSSCFTVAWCNMFFWLFNTCLLQQLWNDPWALRKKGKFMWHDSDPQFVTLHTGRLMLKWIFTSAPGPSTACNMSWQGAQLLLQVSLICGRWASNIVMACSWMFFPTWHPVTQWWWAVVGGSVTGRLLKCVVSCFVWLEPLKMQGIDKIPRFRKQVMKEALELGSPWALLRNTKRFGLTTLYQYHQGWPQQTERGQTYSIQFSCILIYIFL